MTWERQPKVRRKMSRRRTRARSSAVRSGGGARKAGRPALEKSDLIVYAGLTLFVWNGTET